MRITHVIHSQGMASIEMVLLHMLRAMQAHGIMVDGVLINQQDQAADFALSQAQQNGVPVQVIHHTNTLSLRLLQRLQNTLAQQKPDIVHTHGPLADVYGTLAARQAGIKTIISSDYSINTARLAQPFWQSWLQRQIRRNQHAIITPQESTSAKHITIRPGIAPENLRVGQGAHDVTCAELGIPADAPLIGIIADISAPDALPRVLRVLWELTTQQPDLHLLIVGQDDQQGALRQLGQGYHIDQRMHFVSGGTNLPAFLKTIDILLIPQPVIDPTIVMLQALTLGTTILACSCANWSALIKDGETGLLFPIHDDDHMLSSLSLLLGDPTFTRQLATNAKQQMQGRHDFQRMVEAIIALYTQAVR